MASNTGATTCIAAVFAPLDHLEMIRSLEECAGVVADAGVRLALEFAAYGGLARLEDAAALCEAVGWERCGLLLDSWHFFRGDPEWGMLQSLRGDQISLVHVNDGGPDPGEDPALDSRYGRLPLGAGSFALAEFVDGLDTAGYSGVYSLEVLSDSVRHVAPAESARLLIASIRAQSCFAELN